MEACGLKRGATSSSSIFHAEATSEKQALAAYLDGRVTCVVGTHTHVPTSGLSGTARGDRLHV